MRKSNRKFIQRKILTKVYDIGTRGLLKKDAKLPRWKKIGYINVYLLRKFLWRLKEGDLIGIYVFNGKLAPIHCKRHILAPVLPDTKEQKLSCIKSEFEEIK